MKKLAILLSVILLSNCAPKHPMLESSPLQSASKRSFPYIPLRNAAPGEIQRIGNDTFMVAYPKTGDPVMYRVFAYTYSRQAELCRSLNYGFVKGIKKPASFNDEEIKTNRQRIHTYAQCAHQKLDNGYFSVFDRDLTYKNQNQS